MLFCLWDTQCLISIQYSAIVKYLFIHSFIHSFPHIILPFFLTVRFTPIRPPQLRMSPIPFEIPHQGGKPVFIGREWLFSEIEMVLSNYILFVILIYFILEWCGHKQASFSQAGPGRLAVLLQTFLLFFKRFMMAR